MFNCAIKYKDTSGIIYFPCSNNVIYSKLTELHIPDDEKSKINIFVEGIDYEPLRCLENKEVDIDALNQLAKKLSMLTKMERVKFATVVEFKEITDIYDMLNLTDNMHYYTLITDMSDMTKVGKIHIETRDGELPYDMSDEEMGYELIGKDLIESGKGIQTKNGVIFVNDDLEYYKESNPKVIASVQPRDSRYVCVSISYQGNTNYVYLPDVPMALHRAAYRMGASDISKCKCAVEYTEFNIRNSEELNSVEMQSDKLRTILEEVCENEGVEKLNMTVQELMRLDNTYLTHIVPVIEFAENSSSEAIANLVENIDSFVVYGGVSNNYDLGVAEVNANPDYCIHIDLEEFFDYERFGEEVGMNLSGKYMDGDIFVATKDYITLEEILGNDEQEEQNIQMSGM